MRTGNKILDSRKLFGQEKAMVQSRRKKPTRKKTVHFLCRVYVCVWGGGSVGAGHSRFKSREKVRPLLPRETDRLCPSGQEEWKTGKTRKGKRRLERKGASLPWNLVEASH